DIRRPAQPCRKRSGARRSRNAAFVVVAGEAGNCKAVVGRVGAGCRRWPGDARAVAGSRRRARFSGRDVSRPLAVSADPSGADRLSGAPPRLCRPPSQPGGRAAMNASLQWFPLLPVWLVLLIGAALLAALVVGNWLLARKAVPRRWRIALGALRTGMVVVF